MFKFYGCKTTNVLNASKGLRTYLLLSATAGLIGTTFGVAPSPAYAGGTFDRAVRTANDYTDQRLSELPDHSDRLDQMDQKMEQLDKEDMRLKRGSVDASTETMTLRVEDMEKSRGRKKIYGKDVTIDMSAFATDGDVEDVSTRIDETATTIDAVRSASEAADTMMQQSLAAEAAARTASDGTLMQGIVANANGVGANSVGIADNAADIADVDANAAARDGVIVDMVSTDQDRQDSDIAANASGIAGNAERMTESENASVARDAAIFTAVDAGQRRQDQIIAENTTAASDNANEIAKVAEESVARDNAINETVSELSRRQDENYTTMAAGSSANKQSITTMQADIAANRVSIDDNAAGISSLESSVSALQGDVSSLQGNVSSLQDDVKKNTQGIAGVSALSLMTWDTNHSGLQVSGGIGYFDGETAGAVAVGTKLGNKAFANFGATTAGNLAASVNLKF